MLNEGILISDTAVVMKSRIIDMIRKLGPTTPNALEEATFKAVTGYSREDIDFDVEENHTAFRAWVRSFDNLLKELEEDNYIRVEDAADGSGGKVLVPNETDPVIDYSRLTYPNE